jgi:hypothetical protein
MLDMDIQYGLAYLFRRVNMNMHTISNTASMIILGAIVGVGMTVKANSAIAQPSSLPGKAASATQPVLAKTTQEALAASQKAGEFLMVIFYDQKDDLFKGMDQIVTKFKKDSKEKIRVFHAAVKDKAESEIVAKYRIDRARLPLILVFASNGAITGGFEQKVTQEQLNKTLVSELVAKVIKAVRERKVAVVSLQNLKTKFNAESSKVADAFANDPKLKGNVEIIQGDPDDLKNQEFLTQCEIKKPVSTSTLVLLAPPSGAILGAFSGDSVTKDDLINALTPPGGGCGSSGGCGPNPSAGCK